MIKLEKWIDTYIGDINEGQYGKNLISDSSMTKGVVSYNVNSLNNAITLEMFFDNNKGVVKLINDMEFVLPRYMNFSIGNKIIDKISIIYLKKRENVVNPRKAYIKYDRCIVNKDGVEVDDYISNTYKKCTFFENPKKNK